MVNPTGLLLGAVVLFLLLVCEMAGVVCGLAILSTYGAFHE
jgi:hypothetical protein